MFHLCVPRNICEGWRRVDYDWWCALQQVSKVVKNKVLDYGLTCMLLKFSCLKECGCLKEIGTLGKWVLNITLIPRNSRDKCTENTKLRTYKWKKMAFQQLVWAWIHWWLRFTSYLRYVIWIQIFYSKYKIFEAILTMCQNKQT